MPRVEFIGPPPSRRRDPSASSTRPDFSPGLGGRYSLEWFTISRLEREDLRLVEGALHHHADAFAEHLRRRLAASRTCTDGASGLWLSATWKSRWVVRRVPLDAARLHHAAQADGGAVGLARPGRASRRAPVVDEVLADVAEGDEGQAAPGDEQRARRRTDGCAWQGSCSPILPCGAAHPQRDRVQ